MYVIGSVWGEGGERVAGGGTDGREAAFCFDGSEMNFNCFFCFMILVNGLT